MSKTISADLPQPPVEKYDPQNEREFRREVGRLLTTLGTQIDDDPVITAISATFYTDGSAKVTVTGNQYVKSIKCAISTSAYPSTATVEAETAVNGASADFSFAGPYALGNTVYLSAMGYSQAAGAGNASAKKDVKVVVSVIQSTLLVTITQTASTGFSDPGAGVLPTVTLEVTVTDPAGILTGNALVTIAHNGISALYNNTLGAPAVTGNWTIGTTYTLTATLYKALGGGGYAKFTATKSGGYSGYTTWWASSAWADAPADVIITIGNNQSSSDVTAKASLVVNTVENADSMKWLASTSSQPSKATVIASGTSVSTGPPFYVSDLGVTLNLGDTVYVTVVLYDYAGVVVDKSFEAKATRTNLSKTKTVQWAASQFQAYQEDKSGFVGLGSNLTPSRSQDEIYYLFTGPGAGLCFGFSQYSSTVHTFILPDAVTATGMSAELWSANDSDSQTNAIVYVYAVALGSYVTDASPIGSVSATSTGAYQTVSTTFSQSSTSKRFVFYCKLYTASGAGGLCETSSLYAKCRSVTLTYLPSDLQATV
jgi:hypothetical protein